MAKSAKCEECGEPMPAGSKSKKCSKCSGKGGGKKPGKKSC